MIKKVVVLAVVLVALALGSAFAADIDSLTSDQQATDVFVNPGGTGDVLLYGYYNVRDGHQTFFSVTNTDHTYGARVRIRFREAATLTATDDIVIDGCKNGSQEVLDFDICLSENDVWSGKIMDVNGVATLKSADNDTAIQVAGIFTDCNDPDSVCKDSFAVGYPGGQAFKFGAANLGITADQTREGYFEVIAERRLTGEDAPLGEGCGGENEPDCTCGDMYDIPESSVGNVLMGHTYIVNLNDTATFSYAATALADFSDQDETPFPLFGFNVPNLKDGSDGIEGVNYALTKSSLHAIYDIEASIGAQADLIVTFPTKWATHDEFVNVDTCDREENSDDDIFDYTKVLVQIYDDAENLPESETCEFSPCEPGEVEETELPHEVNVLDFNGSGIFTSDVLVALTTNFSFGWINIDLVNSANANPDHETCIDGWCSEGLPAIGYALEKFKGGALSGLIPLQYSSHVED